MPPKPSPKLKFKSDEAAAEALERMLEEDMVQKLDLYDTTFHLHAMDKLTLSETQELQDTGIAELERKRYLLKNVVPTKGPYEGMRALRRALKHSKQTEILNVLEKAYENALNPILVEKLRRLQMAELECQTEVGYPVQATASDCHDDITVFDLSLVRRDDGGTESRSAMSNSVSSDDDDDDNCDYDVTLDSPVEQKFQPSSRVNFRPAVEPQPQSRPNNVASLISIVTMESLQPQSDGVVSLKSLATVESQPCPQSGGGSSLNSSVAMELQPQPQSDSLNSLVITEHPEVEDVGSLDSLIEQQPLQSNNISSTFATESQPQPEFDDAASLNSPVQQSKSPPYVKVMLPQEGTVTLQVAPSPETNGDHNGATGNVIQQPQSRSDNFASFDSLATTESQSQPEVNGTASLNSPVQQPSQSKSPYVKVMLPYEGTITVQVAPSPHDPHPYDTNGNHNGAAGHGNDIIMSVDQVQSDAIVIKFVFVGDASTGKTSLLKRYIDNIFSTKNHVTIIDVKSTELIYDGTKYKLYLWDTVGQERFNRILAKSYLRDTVGAFLVYDVTNRTSFENCLRWKTQIDDAGGSIPVVLIANKIDCPCDSQFDGKQFSQDNGFVGYFETSAKTGVGVKEAIHFMVKTVHRLSRTHQEPGVPICRDHATSIKLHFNKMDGRRRCCLDF